MKLWSAEKTARFYVVSSALFGALTTGVGVFFACGFPIASKGGVFGVTYAVVNSMFLVLAAGMALYLRLRGRRGLAALRACCAAAVAVPLAATAWSVGTLGQIVWVLALQPAMFAFAAHALATRRLERGDDSPLMPGAERLAGATWKEVLLVYLCAAALTALLYAVFGGDHPLFRSHDGWSAEAGREEADVDVTPPRPADIDVDWGSGREP